MDSHAVRVLDATERDLDEMTAAFLNAYSDDFFRAMWPVEKGIGASHMKESWERMLKGWVAQESRLYVVKDEQGVVKSVAHYWMVKPGDGGLWNWRRRYPPVHPGQPDEQVNAFVLAAWHYNMTQQWEPMDTSVGILPSARYIPLGPQRMIVDLYRSAVLENLFTDPSAQRQGYGTALLEKGCNLADEMGLECYLDAVAEAKHLYEKVGYVYQEKHHDRNAPAVPMLRPKRSDR